MMKQELQLPAELPESFRETDPAGLSSEEAARRCADGHGNRTPRDDGKSTSQIIVRNVFTLFNALNVMLAVSLALVGS